MNKKELVEWLKTLFDKEWFFSEKYGSNRCSHGDDWFSQGYKENIIGVILEKIENELE